MGQTTTQQFPGQVTIQVSLIDVEEALDVLSQTHRLVVVVSLAPDGQTKTTTQDLQHLAVAPPWWRCQNLRGRHGEILQKSPISLNLIFLVVSQTVLQSTHIQDITSGPEMVREAPGGASEWLLDTGPAHRLDVLLWNRALQTPSDRPCHP